MPQTCKTLAKHRCRICRHTSRTCAILIVGRAPTGFKVPHRWQCCNWSQAPSLLAVFQLNSRALKRLQTLVRHSAGSADIGQERAQALFVGNVPTGRGSVPTSSRTLRTTLDVTAGSADIVQERVNSHCWLCSNWIQGPSSLAVLQLESSTFVVGRVPTQGP